MDFSSETTPGQVDLLVEILGIRSPDLRKQAENLIRDALRLCESPPPISKPSIVGRLMSLIPKKKSKKNLHVVHNADECEGRNMVSPSSQPLWIPPSYDEDCDSFWDDDSDPFYVHDPVFEAPAHPVHQFDPVLKGDTYNSQGRRLDSDDEIVVDIRVFMCEQAIAHFDGQPHISDIYDLYAQVRNLDVKLVPEACKVLLEGGLAETKHKAKVSPPSPTNKDVGTFQPATKARSPTNVEVCAQPEPNDCVSRSALPSELEISKKELDSRSILRRNALIAYIHSIKVPPELDAYENKLPENASFKFRKKTDHARRSREKAVLRQVKLYLPIIKELFS